MSDQANNAHAFAALHVKGDPLVLFNIWDAGSAKAVTEAGAKALAIGSWSVAAAHGYPDGEKLPLDLALENFKRIVAATSLPVSMDIESGYGKTPDEVARTVARIIEAGAIGCNLEDSYPESGKLRPVEEQVARIRAARKAAQAAGIDYFINARTDVFFQKPAAQHDQAMLEEAIARAKAYAQAGASGIFAPGLADIGLIKRMVEGAVLPLNIMASTGTPARAELAAAGVARISHGPGPYRAAMKALAALAQA